MTKSNLPHRGNNCNDSPYLTVKQAAAYCHCSTSTIRKWINRGGLKACGKGKKLIQKDDLDDYLER